MALLPQNPGIGGIDELTADEEVLIAALDAIARTKGNIIVGNGTTFVGLSVGTNGQILKADSTQASGVKWADVNGGITSLNGLTGGTQTFATGTTGTDFAISSSGTAHTFNIPTASVSNRGLLSATDWTTFNDKTTGAASSTDNAIVRFDSTTGKIIQNSGVIIDDTNNISGIVNGSFTGYLNATGIATPTAPAAGDLRWFAQTTEGFSRPAILGGTTTPITVTRDLTAVVRNTTGATLTKGTVVYVSGSTGTVPIVSKAKADALTTLGTIGVIFEDIADVSYGIALTRGAIVMDTSAFSTGDEVYVSATTAGMLTNVKPTHPNYQRKVGVILNSGVGNGVLAIDIGTTAGDDIGTAQNTFSIGSNLTGTKTLEFKNGFTGSLSWTPTATRTLTLPDTTGTITALGNTTTGSGSIVLDTSPTLVTPTLGVATATSINKVAITAPATSATLTLADGSTLATSGAFSTTLTATAATNVTLPTTGTLATLTGAETLSSKTLTAPKFADLGYIADANGNELLILDTVASAVNEITLANAATTTNPSLTATGGDTNVGIDFNLKGSGTLNIKGNSTQAGTLRLYEDTDNGTNYTGFKVGTQSADIDYVLPTAQGAASTVLTNDGSGNLSWEASTGGSSVKTVSSTIFEDVNRMNTTVSNGTVTLSNTGATVDTSATASSYATLYIQGFSGVGTYAEKGSPMLSITGRMLTDGTDFRGFVGIGNPTIAGSGITYTPAHIGFRIQRISSGNIEIIATKSDGTTVTASPALTTLVNGDYFELFLKVNGTSSVDYYWSKNGSALSSATNLSGNMPSGLIGNLRLAISNAGVATQSSFVISSAYYERNL